jgi:hypothetical protein
MLLDELRRGTFHTTGNCRIGGTMTQRAPQWSTQRRGEVAWPVETRRRADFVVESKRKPSSSGCRGGSGNTQAVSARNVVVSVRLARRCRSVKCENRDIAVMSGAGCVQGPTWKRAGTTWKPAAAAATCAHERVYADVVPVRA